MALSDPSARTNEMPDPSAEAADGDHRATITQRLAARVRERILAGAYAPGAPLREGELGERYGVSRHVIREVLRTLAADGLIDYTSFKGARVPAFTEVDARDIYRARRMVECGSEAMSPLPDPALIECIHRNFAEAVRARDWPRAFELDVAFHSAIVAAAGSARTAAWHKSLLRDLRLAHLAAPTFNERVFADSVAQHAEITAAIAAGDASGARAAMKRHLDDAERALLEEMAAADIPAR
jgi:DNA-binding GntR family transcriptional regulator